MAYFAKLDNNNIIINTIVADSIANKPSYENWVEFTLERPASKGGSYDPVADVLIAPQPYVSWVLDDNKNWKAPVDVPEVTYTHEGIEYSYTTEWDEANLRWLGRQTMVNPDVFYAWDPNTSTWNSI